MLWTCGDIHMTPGPDLNNLLSVCYCNIRSVTPDKIDHIELGLPGKYKIITISETWLKIIMI